MARDLRAEIRARRLRARVSKAVEKGQHRKAAQLYEALEQAEPHDGAWSKGCAEMYRRLGKSKHEVEALERAADRFARAGFLLKAIGVCKRILDIVPDHSSTQETLVSLYARHQTPASSSVHTRAFPGVRARPVAAPLEEIVLTDAVEGAAPASFDGGSLTGVAEIPLGETRSTNTAELTLPRVPLFSSLDRGSLHELINRVERIPLEEGQTLFREGDPGQHLYVIVEGAVSLSAVRDGAPKLLKVLRDGDFFGEIALVTNHPRNATVEAVSETSLLSIDRDLVASLIARSPTVLKTLLRFVRARLVDRLLHTSPLFDHLDSNQQRELVKRFRLLEVKDKSRLVRQGKPSKGLFVGLSGSFEVTRGGEGQERELARLGVGDVFGEMSILTDEPAVATVRSVGRAWVLALPASDLRELLLADPYLRHVIVGIAAERRREPGAKESLPLG